MVQEIRVRSADWPERLDAYIEARRNLPFAWGKQDCALFAVDWVREATGVDLIPHLRGSWHDEVSALRVLNDVGGLRNMGEILLGAPISTAFAGRGDLVVVDVTGRDGLGICLGATIAAPGEVGLTIVPRSLARLAWRV